MVSLDKLVLSVIVFFVLIIGGVLIVHDVETNYADENVDMGINQYLNNTWHTTTGTDINDYDYNSLNSSSELYSNSEDYQSRALGELGDGTTEDEMFAGSFSAIRLITTPISLLKSVLNEVAINIGIPGIFVQYAFIALTIMVMFGVIYLVFRVRS